MRKTEDTEIINRFRNLLKKKGETQQEVANKLGYSRAYIAQILSGRALISGSFLKALLENDYDIQWILVGKSDKEQKIELIKELEIQNEYINKLENLLLKATNQS